MDSSSEGFTRVDETFPEQLRLARKRLGVSQELLTEEMAKRGYPVHLTTIGKIERQERKVTIGEAAAIADALGVSLASMIGDATTLQSTYAQHAQARRLFTQALETYVLALLDVARAADTSPGLGPRDAEWLVHLLSEQTPAQMTLDAPTIASAAISREAIERGPAVSFLEVSLTVDKETLVEELAERKRSADEVVRT